MSNRRKIRPANRPRRTLPIDQAYWNGLPTTATRGTAVVADSEAPQYWARHEGLIGSRIPVVRIDLDGVNAGGGVAYLDDRGGSGWAKVTRGLGSPRYGHRNVRVESGSFRASQ